MYQRLKECKTLKEIYIVLGKDFFEKVAFILLLLWCMLPLFAVLGHLIIGVSFDLAKVRLANVVFMYKLLVEILGKISLLFVAFYLLGRTLLMGKEVLFTLKRNPWHIFLLMMLLHACISTLLSQNVSIGFFGSEYRFDGLLTYFFYASVYVLGTIIIEKKRVRNILLCFLGVAVCVGFLIIMQDWHFKEYSYFFMSRRAGVFFHFNHAGYYLNLALVVASGLYIFAESKAIRSYCLVALWLLTVSLLVNSTLGAFLASLGATCFLMLFYIRRNSNFKIRILVPILIMLAMAFCSYKGWIPTSSGQDMAVNVETMAQDFERILDNEDVEKIGHGRATLWKKCLEMIPNRPIFGYGPEQLDEELSKGMWVDRPDNELIQHAVFLGIPGFLYYLLALLTLYIARWKQIKKLDFMMVVSAGCVIAYLGSSLLGNTMFYTTPYFYLFLGVVAKRGEIS